MQTITRYGLFPDIVCFSGGGRVWEEVVVNLDSVREINTGGRHEGTRGRR